MNKRHTRRGETQIKRVGQARPDNVPSKGHPSVLMTGKNGLCCQVKPDLHDRKGFTLIELLVVVLIIGILAAVAVPQYQKAVMKSQFMLLKNPAEKIIQAEQIYFLENGVYTTNFENLSISLPGSLNNAKNTISYKDLSCFLQTAAQNVVSVQCSNPKIGMTYASRTNGTRGCTASNNNPNSMQNKICKEDTGKGLACPGSYCMSSY